MGRIKGKKHPSVNTKVVEEVVGRLRMGETQKEIADSYGMSRAWVGMIKRRLMENLKTDPPPEPAVKMEAPEPPKTDLKLETYSEEKALFIKRLVLVGESPATIAGVLGIALDTLIKLYGYDMHRVIPSANATVAHALYKQAASGNVRACEVWLRYRAGWKDDAPMSPSEPADERKVFSEDELQDELKRRGLPAHVLDE